MEFPVKFNFKAANVLKIAGLTLLAIIVLVVAFRLIGSSFNSVFRKTAGVSSLSMQIAPSYNAKLSNEVAYDSAGGVGLSSRNVISEPTPAPASPSTGDNAEEFEVSDYNATIETRRLKDTCAQVMALKARPEVIFESASESEHACNYSFKVKRAQAAEILGVVKSFDPKELTENTYTIKGLVDDYTSETEILQKKLASIDDTLKKAISAYDGVTALATRVQDIESLAKIIDSKITIIERLTQERISVNAQLERLSRAKAVQLDRLEYTYFNLNILENKFVDGQSLKDSWKTAIKEFVRDVNAVAQDITVNLAVVLLLIAQYALYIFILLVVVKYGWQLAKYIWRR